MALVATGTECALLTAQVMVKEDKQLCQEGRKVPLTLQMGRSPPRDYKVLISPIPKNKLGVDLLGGQTLQTLNGEIGLRLQ